MISLDYKGFYWEQFDENQKPINPKECQIIFSPKDGGKLSYFLNIDEEFQYEETKDKRIKVLYGQASGGKNFTLYNLKFESARPHFTANIELTEVVFSVEYIFYEGFVDIGKKLPIIHVRYSYLELWFNQLDIKRPHDDENKTFAGIAINKEYLKGSSAEYDVLFNINNGFNQSSFNNKTITYEVTNSLAIAKKENFTIEEAINLSLHVKNFFEIVTFYSKNKIFIEKFYITQKRKLKNGYEVDEIVYLLFKQDDYIEERKMTHLDFLFRYNDVKENFVAILNNWIENHDKNQNEYQAFCNVIADKSSKFNIYSHYFQLISALEGYHTRNSQKDIEFRKRLNELIKKSDIKNVLTLSSKIHKSVANCIYDLRNDIAHSKKTIEITERVNSSFEYLKIMALSIILKDISLSHAKISQNIFDMNIKFVQNQLIEAFSEKQND